MGKALPLVHAFNRGVVSPLALGRTDVDRIRLSAEKQTNWLPRTIGPMMLRPGMAFTGSPAGYCVSVPFVFAADDTARLELSDELMRVWIDDELVTRPAVSTPVDNFTVPASWTLVTSGGGVSSIAAGVLSIARGPKGGIGTATQNVNVPLPDVNTEHALRIVVTRGPVKFHVGTTSGADNVVASTTLDTGTHSIAFTPGTTSIYVQFRSGNDLTNRTISSCSLEAAGTFTLDTPWTLDILRRVRHAQSADVVYVAAPGIQQRKIERRSTRGWSIVLYQPEDGPFAVFNDSSVRLTPSVRVGDGTLTADRQFFDETDVGGLFSIFHNGQTVSETLSTSDVYTSAIRVSGVCFVVDSAGASVVTTDRNFTVVVGASVFVGTLTLQRSFDGPDAGFTDYQTFTVPGTTTITDNLNNIICWYRIGFKTAAYTSGVADVTLNYSGGGDTGICRVLSYTSATVVGIEVLKPFAASTGSTDWKQGQWSPGQGYPTAVALHEGRLWWAGNDRAWGSVSDGYESFDLNYPGDAGPINRSIGEGPIANVHSLVSSARLVVFTDVSEIPARSSSFDEPLTPTNFTLKAASTQGSAEVCAVKIDSRVLFVQRSGKRLFEMAYSVESGDYKTRDLTRLNPEILSAGVLKIVVQRQPDTRVHCILADGTVACLLYDPADEAEAWFKIETDESGFIEDACVLPGPEEDIVYYTLIRNGIRTIERHARIEECHGDAITKCVDSHIISDTGGLVTTVTGLDHLEGLTVYVWGDGLDLGTATVSGGQINLATGRMQLVVGTGYTAQYKSTKLAYGVQGGTALLQKKRLAQIGLLLSNTHAQGVTYGRDFDNQDEMPLISKEAEVDQDVVPEAYDAEMFAFDGSWDTDARLCLVAQSPAPCTVVGAVLSLETHDAG